MVTNAPWLFNKLLSNGFHVVLESLVWSRREREDDSNISTLKWKQMGAN